MKRKRGSKKGKSKKPKSVSTNEAVSNIGNFNAEDNSGLNELENEDIDSGVDAETEKSQSPARTSQPEKPAPSNDISRPVDNAFGRVVYTRVKVKLKTSKTLESHRASSGAPTQSDTDKSSQQVGSQRLGRVPNEKMEDSSNSLPEPNGDVTLNASKKPIGIKIKSSRGFGSSSMSPCSNAEQVKGDKMEKKDAGSLQQDSKYNEQELKLALEVIRKVMKMDAAEPFNVPVNPVALGIPDYFDVINTPMDFGTICNNLEKGVKYMNSEDVLKDVEHIWDNCYKYNNKGDYIVELMKRVKKNFTKYWTAVGLFNDLPQENNDSESNPGKDSTPPSQGNTTPVNSGVLSLSSKKFHGLKKHKDGCLCAICVMMRRRQEREEIARMMGGPTEGSDDSLGEDMKPEGTLHGDSPFVEYASSNMENSPDTDADVEKKGQEMKLGHISNFYDQLRENEITVPGKEGGSHEMQLNHTSGDRNNSQDETPQVGSVMDVSLQNADGSAAIDRQKPKELLDKNERAKMLENLRYLENPMLLNLYGTLFADDSKSFWNGPHSLAGRQSTARRSSFHSAISTFMK